MPQGYTVGGGTVTVFDVDVLAQIDHVVLDFPISLALWNGGA